MITVNITPRFEKNRKKFVKNNLPKAKKLLATLDMFRHNPSHPGLNTEKLVNSDIYSIRINKSDRIFFTWIDKKTALLIDIGKHDKYKILHK